MILQRHRCLVPAAQGVRAGRGARAGSQCFAAQAAAFLAELMVYWPPLVYSFLWKCLKQLLFGPLSESE